ncbi:MAG: DUF2953 domain-containing protein [Candidatus Ventricola sp.]
MLSLIAALYLLLALRVRFRAEASVCGEGSSLSFAAGAAGVELRFDGELRREEGGLFLRVTPRYGAPLQFSKPTKLHIRRLRAARPYLLAAVRAGRLERVTLRARLGLEDAAATAVAAGSLRALVLALLARLDSKAPCELRVTPDFGGVGLAAHACCIFSCQAGDIMFAVIKTAVRKTGREGFGWKSIPLRA